MAQCSLIGYVIFPQETANILEGIGNITSL